MLLGELKVQSSKFKVKTKLQRRGRTRNRSPGLPETPDSSRPQGSRSVKKTGWIDGKLKFKV
jgi:hypothetical protein